MTSQAFVWKIINDYNKVALDEIKHPDSWSSLDEITRVLPKGAYTTFRTYQHNSTIHFNDHVERLKETCHISGHSLAIDSEMIRSGIREILLSQASIPELRFRITIDLDKHPGDIFLSVEPLTTPSPLEYKTGVRVATKSMSRSNPKAKLSQFAISAIQVRKEFGPKFNEIIMIGVDDQMLEGLSSNFFAIKDGKIWTEDKDVLSGITRSMVLEVAVELGIPVIKKGILLDELRFVKEIFITSTSRSILPVKEIDRYWTYNTVPGPITQKIMQAFEFKIQKILEVI